MLHHGRITVPATAICALDIFTVITNVFLAKSLRNCTIVRAYADYGRLMSLLP